MYKEKLELSEILNFYKKLVKENIGLKISFYSLILLSLISSGLEIISFRFFSEASNLLEETFESDDFTLFIIFVFTFISANLIRLFYLFIAARLSYKVAAIIDNKAFLTLSNINIQFNNKFKELIEKYLTTSSMIIAPNIYLPFFLFINSIFATIGILSFLIYLYGFQVIFLFLIILTLYFIYFKVFKLISNSNNDVSKFLIKRNTTLLDVRFNFVELYTLNLSEKLYKQFKNTQNGLRKTESLINFNSFSPRYFIEIFILILITLIILLYKDLDAKSLILIGSTYGYAFLRLLPFIQTAYGSLNTILSFKKLLYESIYILSLSTKNFKIYNANLNQNNNSTTLAVLKDFAFTEKNKNKFKPISQTIKLNSIYSVTGPSGVGKSCLINYLSLGRSLLPSTGSIDLFYKPNYFNSKNFIPNKKIDAISMGQYSKFRSGNLYEVLFDYLIYMGIYNKDDLLHNKEIEDLVNECISLLNMDFILSEGKNSFIDSEKLSGGQSQRVCIARSLISALILDPKLLIWDEPFSSLDKILGLKIFNNLLKSNYKFTIILVSHLKLNSNASNFFEIKLEKL